MCLLPHINVTTKRHVLHGLSGVSSGTELQLSRAVPCCLIQPLQAFFLLCLTSPLLHHASWNHLPNKLLLPKPLPQLLLSGYLNLRQCPYTVYNSLHHWGPASSFTTSQSALCSQGVQTFYQLLSCSRSSRPLHILSFFSQNTVSPTLHLTSSYSTLKYLLKCHFLQEAFLNFQIHVLCSFYLLSEHPVLPKHSTYHITL